MCAVDSGHIQLVGEGLNNNLNPFLKDALGRTAIDLAGGYRGVLGADMRQLLHKAMEQWIEQTDEDDRTGAQEDFPDHFEEFKQE